MGIAVNPMTFNLKKPQVLSTTFGKRSTEQKTNQHALNFDGDIM